MCGKLITREQQKVRKIQTSYLLQLLLVSKMDKHYSLVNFFNQMIKTGDCENENQRE